MRSGVAPKCARLRLMAHGSAATKRFFFLIMSRRRDCSMSESESSVDLKRWQLFCLEFASVLGFAMYLMALACSA